MQLSVTVTVRGLAVRKFPAALKGSPRQGARLAVRGSAPLGSGTLVVPGREQGSARRCAVGSSSQIHKRGLS